jgi:aryl-alcohol dehydrogenase-like predicted oxidoreductase
MITLDGSYHKLALGTAQFGLDYGLQNEFGQVPFDQVTAIIDFAAKQGISVLDTANMYGTSQQVLGTYLANTPEHFKIVSKIKTDSMDEARRIFSDCLSTLGINQLYGYLIHRFAEYQTTPAIYDFLLEQKQLGIIRKLGFSLYFPDELEYLLDHQVPIDIVQFPLSILDQRFLPYLPILRQKKIEVHVRSVLLQGILAKPFTTLPSHFDPVKPKLQALEKYAQHHQIPLAALALNFAQLQPEVDQVVIGVHTLDQLKNNIRATDYMEQSRNVLSELLLYKETDEQIIVPLNWPV